jgi:hypothetical protein
MFEMNFMHWSMHNICCLPFQNDYLLKFQFTIYLFMINTLKKRYSWNKNYQTFHVIHKHGPKHVKSYVKYILQIS